MKAKNLMKWIIVGALACSMLAVGACSKSDKDDNGQATPATGAQQAPSNLPNEQTAPGSDILDEDVPVETDFEEAAEKEISADNYQQELDTLEKEITGGG